MVHGILFGAAAGLLLGSRAKSLRSLTGINRTKAHLGALACGGAVGTLLTQTANDIIRGKHRPDATAQ
jgi:hypothetical protein